MRKFLSVLAACAVPFALFLAAATPAAADFPGQPTWLADPSGVCTYVGRLGCPLSMGIEPVPMNATPETASSGSVAAATASASLPATALKTQYLTGFSITGGGATSASLVLCTITGPIGGTMTYVLGIPAGATTAISPFSRSFVLMPIVASAVNTAITVSCPTFGAGNTNASVNVEGYLR